MKWKSTPLKVAQSNPARLNCANTDGIQLNDCSYVWVDNIDVPTSMKSDGIDI